MKKFLFLSVLAFAFTGIAEAKATATYINVPVAVLPAAVVGENYSYKIEPTGGAAPYFIKLHGGSLPAGLALGTDGTVSGVVSGNGTEFTLDIIDASGYMAVSKGILIPVAGEGSAKVMGTVSFANGTLVNDNGTVYGIYRNMKVPFTTPDAFVSLGYKWSNLVNSNTASLATATATVNSASATHPWGSWVSKGKTVYFVSDTGLIPISTYSIFLNNGGNPKLIVPANDNDLSSPMLELMTMNDPRV